MRYRNHLKYLLRAMAWAGAMLALWWILLVIPLEAALRFSTEMVFRACLWADPPAQIAIAPDGRWSMRIPVPAPIARRDEIQQLFGRTSPDAPYVKVRSLRLDIPGRDPSLFLVTLPFFWALMLAGGANSGKWRAVAAGSGILLPLAVVLMTFDVVRTFVFSTHLAISALTESLLHAGDMAALDVIPYLAPVVLALILDRKLRASIFSSLESADLEAVPLMSSTQRGVVRRGWNKGAVRRVGTGS